MKDKPDRPIKVGVVGVGRGQTFMRQAAAAGMELAAVCDLWRKSGRSSPNAWRKLGRYGNDWDMRVIEE